MTFPEIIFQGKTLLLCSRDGHDGPLATMEDYAAFRVSYAHLMPNGDIMRFGQRIGCREDVQFTGHMVDVEAGEAVPGINFLDRLFNGLLDEDEDDEVDA